VKPFHTLSYIQKENWPIVSARHADLLADNPTPVGSVKPICGIIYK